MNLQLLWGIFLIALLPIHTFGQGRTISGSVSNAEGGQAIIGATVTIIGTTTGVLTDANGEFTLPINANTDSLRVAYYGFQTQRIAVGTNSIFSITMMADIKSLDEIVVVGYGSMRKSDMTGSVYSVKGEDLVKNPSANVLQALQGKVPGVQVSSFSGNPGESPVVRIRGIATFLGGASPVFVVDGVILDDISFLNSGDVESVEVLKDASATAIYGTRGANGVILITTRRGKEGKPVVSVNANYSVEQLANKIDLLTGPQFAEIVNEISPGTYNNLDLVPNTDWQDLIFEPMQPIRQFEISASAAQDRHAYYVGASYFSQEGIIEKSDYERYSVKFNNSLEAASFLTLGSDLTFSLENKTNPPGVVASAYRAWPTVEPLDDDGNFLEVIGSGNPLASIEYANSFNKRLRGISNLYADFNFLKHFSFRTSYQLDLAYVKATSFTPVFFVSTTQQNEINDLSKTSRDEATWIWENTLRFNKEFGEDHRVNALLGYTSQMTNREGLTGVIENVIRETPDFFYLNAGDATTIDAFNGLVRFSYVSYLARLNYVFKNRYLFTGTYRRDGSSKFGPNNRYGDFPSLALGWRITEEPFMQDIALVNNLKLRASWGVNGNDKIPYEARFARVTGSNLEAVFGQNEILYPGATLSDAGNPNLQWENTESYDVGLEFGLWDNRLTGEIDYFNKRTNKVLVPLLLPAHFGNGPFRRVVFNAADIRNVGIEFFLTWRESKGDFTYGITLLGSKLRNTTLDIGAADEFIQDGSLNNGQLVTRTQRGIPVGAFYGYKVAGVFQNQDELDLYPVFSGQRVGDFRYEDINQDGVINPDDRTVLGSYIPDYLFGFTLNLAYKGFEFDADIQGQEGK